MLVGAVGIEPTAFEDLAACTGPVIILMSPSWVPTNHTNLVLSQPVLDQIGECEESRDSPVYSPNTAYGQPAVCSRGRCRRCIEGFLDGLHFPPSIAG